MPGNEFIMVSKGVVGASLFLTVFAGVVDIRRFIIPNWISFSVLLLGIVYLVLSDPSVWLGHVGAAAVVFAVGLILFSLRLFGGGDVKLMTALAFWSGFEHLMDFAFVTAVAGGFVSLIYLLRAVWFKRNGGTVEVLRAPVPYGVAITIGGVYLFLTITGQIG